MRITKINKADLDVYIEQLNIIKNDNPNMMHSNKLEAVIEDLKGHQEYEKQELGLK